MDVLKTMNDWFTLSDSSSTDFTIVYTDTSTNYNVKKDPLQQMKEDFDVLKDNFFLEKFDKTPYISPSKTYRDRKLSELM